MLVVVSALSSNIVRVCLSMTLASVASCGGTQTGTQSAADTDGAEISCAAPIGTIPRENCNDISADFGALSVDGALRIASSSKGSDERIEAIRAAGDLAKNLKDRRVDLCTQYNACKMTLAEHNAEDVRLAAVMASLIKLWDERKFLDGNGVNQLHAQVKTLAAQLEGKTIDARGNVTASQPTTWKVPGDKLAKLEGSGLTFSPAAAGIAFSTTTDGTRDALRAGLAELHAKAGNRYQIDVTGSYTPAAPALIKSGDELTVRFKYRANQTGNIYVALRSLEDPDATESTSKLPVEKAAAGDHQATFTAVPGSSGFYVGIGMEPRNAGFDFDDVEILRAGSVIASALAETPTEAHVETKCARSTTKPITGKASFACEAGTVDAVTIGRPRGHLFITVRDSTGDRTILRTLSLDGDRSIDAKFTDNASLVIGLLGPGSATIQAVEIKPL